MNRGRYGGTILLLMVAAIAMLALVAVADDSEAAILGKPLPSWGADWIIDQDTVATGETIRLDGEINVRFGYTLSLDGCTVIFNSSYDGEHGFYVNRGATLYINETTVPAVVKANTTSEMWRFNNVGDSYLVGADLTDLTRGVWNDNYVYIEDCTIESDSYGVVSFGDCHVGNSTIDVTSDGSIWGFEAMGIACLYGSGSLHNLDISVDVDMDETYNTSYYSGSCNVFGIYAYSADLGKLEPDGSGDFKIALDVDIAIHNYYDYSTVYVDYAFNTGAISLSGNTVCRKINDIDISVSETFHGDIFNATSMGFVTVYNQQRYISSTISSSGVAPTEISMITLESLGVVATSGGVAEPPRVYYYNYALYLSDSKGARPADAMLEVHDVTVKESTLDTILYMPRYGEWELFDCTFDTVETNRIMYYSSGDSDFMVASNSFTNITGMNDRTDLIYIYGPSGEGTIIDNTFSNIEGWSLMEISYPADRIYIQWNDFIDNIQWERSYDPWLYFYENKDKVTFSENTFDTCDIAEGLIYIRYSRDKFVFKNNDIMNGMYDSYMLRSYRTYGDLEVGSNVFKNNEGRLFWFEYNHQRLSFTDNLLEDNRGGADYLLYTYYTYGEIKFEDNLFTNNTVDGAMIYMFGPTFWGTYGFTFDRNIFRENTASTALNGGLVVLKSTRYNTNLKRNEFYDNDANCINFYRPYTYNSFYTGYTFTVDGSTFQRNTGAATLWVDITGYNVVVKRTVNSNGNDGPLVKVVLTAHYVYDSTYPQTYGEIRGAWTYTVESNTYNSNNGGSVDIQAQYHDPWVTYTNSGQKVNVNNNDFFDNGPGGWSIRIVDFGLFPNMRNNDVLGSNYGVFLEAIDYTVLFPRVLLEFTDETFDGGNANGMTAYGLVNVDANFYNCTFTNFKEALYAADCIINVYWSTIAEASGRTEGRGYIYVWNHLEILVTWADANDMDSGMPAAGATVAMLGTNGKYYGEMVTDSMGRIGPELVMPWSSSEGRMDQWSPYSTTVYAGGLTASHTITVDGETVGSDAVHLIIKDGVVPEIVVTSPSMDAMSNLEDMPVEGFLFETGSGVETFMGYLDGSTEGVAIEPQLQWMAEFEDLEQGEHTIDFEAMDLAGNMATASVTFFIDSMIPDLNIISPEDGEVTRESTMLIQGTYEDDVSDISEITVRINGVIQDTTTGVINEYISLTEGVNSIVIDATDKAGNTAVETRIVTLDTTAPILYVYSPLDDLVTADQVLVLTGLSEAFTPIMVEQVQGSDIIFDDLIEADEDGQFSTVIFLEEGLQNIVFTAEDEAGNVNSITRKVTLDTVPPSLTINLPEDGSYVKAALVRVVGLVDDPDLENVVVRINLIRVDQNGVFQRDVPLVEGLNTIVVTATDAVMNTATETVTVTRDTIPPVLVVDTPDNILTNQEMLEVRGSVNADADTVTVAGVEVNIGEDGSFLYEVDLPTETTPITVMATDRAGNTASYYISFVFDNVKPNLQLTDVPPAKTTRLVMYVNGTVTDNVATILFVEIRGGMYPVVDGKFNVLLTTDTAGDGWNNFTVIATDDAGNVALQRVDTQYIREDITDDDGPEEETSDLLWYIGLLLILAAVVMFLTVFVFHKRGERA